MRRNSEPGQALVEFALIAPIFFLLLFAVIQLSLIFGAQNGLVNSVRDTARRAATFRVNALSLDSFTLPGVCTSLQTELLDRMDDQVIGFSAAGIDPTSEIAYVWKENNDSPRTYFLVAQVTVVYDHPLYVPLVSYFIDGTDGTVDGRLTLEASEQMRVENPDIAVAGTSQACSQP